MNGVISRSRMAIGIEPLCLMDEHTAIHSALSGGTGYSPGGGRSPYDRIDPRKGRREHDA